MTLFIIFFIVYGFSVYHSVKSTKYLYRLYDMELDLIDLIGCFIPVANTTIMIMYLFIKKK
jgi:hypothetical protein